MRGLLGMEPKNDRYASQKNVNALYNGQFLPGRHRHRLRLDRVAPRLRRCGSRFDGRPASGSGIVSEMDVAHCPAHALGLGSFPIRSVASCPCRTKGSTPRSCVRAVPPSRCCGAWTRAGTGGRRCWTLVGLRPSNAGADCHRRNAAAATWWLFPVTSPTPWRWRASRWTRHGFGNDSPAAFRHTLYRNRRQHPELPGTCAVARGRGSQTPNSQYSTNPGSAGVSGGESCCITLLLIGAFRCTLCVPSECTHAGSMAERRKKTIRLTVSLDEADYAALNAMASRSDVSASWVIRQAVQRFLREHDAQPELPLTLAERASGREASG